MIRSACDHGSFQKHGKDRHGNQRYRCNLCLKTWIVEQPKPLGEMRVPLDTAKLVLRLLTEGSSIGAAERVTGVHRETICKLVVYLWKASEGRGELVRQPAHETLHTVIAAGEVVIGGQVLPDPLRRKALIEFGENQFALGLAFAAAAGACGVLATSGGTAVDGRNRDLAPLDPGGGMA